jgi:integrase
MIAGKVKDWLKVEAARRPTQAALAFRLLRAFVRWYADQKEYKAHVHADACNSHMSKDTLPKAGIKDDCLQREQLPAWFAAVRAIGNPTIAAYLQCLLLVGSRREELATVKWQDVDFQWKAITIHDKVEGERTIPLTPFVASLLAALPRRKDREGNPSPWVFSSPTSASGRLMELSIQHRRVTAAAGIEGLSLHGLRRSFGTLSEWCEACLSGCHPNPLPVVC